MRDPDSILSDKDKAPSADSGTSTGTSATEEWTTTEASLRTDDPQETTGVSETTTDASTITDDDSSPTTVVSSSTPDVSSSTDGTTEVLVNKRSGLYKPKQGILEKFQGPNEIIRSCCPHCDNDEDGGSVRVCFLTS